MKIFIHIENSLFSNYPQRTTLGSVLLLDRQGCLNYKNSTCPGHAGTQQELQRR